MILNRPKVGDTYYGIASNKNSSWITTGTIIQVTNTHVKVDVLMFTKKASILNIEERAKMKMSIKWFMKNSYLTREEAEKALKYTA